MCSGYETPVRCSIHCSNNPRSWRVLTDGRQSVAERRCLSEEAFLTCLLALSSLVRPRCNPSLNLRPTREGASPTAGEDFPRPLGEQSRLLTGKWRLDGEHGEGSPLAGREQGATVVTSGPSIRAQPVLVVAKAQLGLAFSLSLLWTLWFSIKVLGSK